MQVKIDLTKPFGSLAIRFFNSLHGFNVSHIRGDDKTLLIGIAYFSGDIKAEPPRAALEKEINKQLAVADVKSPIVTVDDFLARMHIFCRIDYRHLVGKIIDIVRRLGFKITLSTALKPTYAAETTEKCLFSKENSEMLFLESYAKFVLELGEQEVFRIVMSMMPSSNLRTEAAWATKEGKAFAASVDQNANKYRSVDVDRAIDYKATPFYDIGLKPCDYDFPPTHAKLEVVQVPGGPPVFNASSTTAADSKENVKK